MPRNLNHFLLMQFSSYGHVYLFRRYYIEKNMIPKTYLFICLVLKSIHSGSSVFKSFYGIKTNEYPKESCHRIDNIRSKGQCLGTCVISMDRIVMISHNESTKTCMCCSDMTGSDISGPNWRSYVPRKYLCFMK